jgi:hypothetical protein
VFDFFNRIGIQIEIHYMLMLIPIEPLLREFSIRKDVYYKAKKKKKNNFTKLVPRFHVLSIRFFVMCGAYL